MLLSRLTLFFFPPILAPSSAPLSPESLGACWTAKSEFFQWKRHWLAHKYSHPSHESNHLNGIQRTLHIHLYIYIQTSWVVVFQGYYAAEMLGEKSRLNLGLVSLYSLCAHHSGSQQQVCFVGGSFQLKSLRLGCKSRDLLLFLDGISSKNK